MSEPDTRLVTLRHAPFQGHSLREGLDAALVAAAFGQSVSLLFLGQGIFALMKDQQSGAPGQKAVLPTIDMLEMYDIDELMVPESQLESLGLDARQLVEGVTIISDEALSGLYRRFSAILNF